MTDILDQIDTAIGCQQCGGPLRDSPSDDFCGESCQEEWHEARADALYIDECYGLFQQQQVRDFADLHAIWLSRTQQAIQRFGEQVSQLGRALDGWKSRTDAMDSALAARRNRNTGPQQVVRAPRKIGRVR